MTDKAPDLNRYKLVRNEPGYSDQMLRRADGAWVKYAEAATALEAAQARIAELEARFRSTVGMVADATKILTDTPSRSEVEIRAEALEEAAKVADEIMRREAASTYSYGDVGISSQSAAKTYCAGEIAAAIRALKEKPNGDE